MSITKAQALTAVNDNLKRSESDIDRELLLALKKLSGAGNFLFSIDDSQSLASGDTSLNYPTDYKSLVEIVLNDGTTDGRPLTEITYEEYLKKKEDETSANYNEPENYAEINNKFYVHPTADDDYTAKIHHHRYHPESLTTIVFRDEWREAIYSLTSYYVAKRFKLQDYIVIYGGNDMGALAMAVALGAANLKEQPQFVTYRDI